MTCPSLTLESVAYALPDGSALFSDLNIHIDQRATGLVGRIGLVARTAAASPHCCSCWPGASSPAPGIARCMRRPPIWISTWRCWTRRLVVAQLQDADPAAPAHAQRLRLTLLGRDRARADLPCSQLSGGQRLKAALACALYRAQPAQLLLLDEPTHHLDLASVEAIGALRGHQGAPIVASHDAAFLQGLGLQQRLDTAQAQWRLAPW